MTHSSALATPAKAGAQSLRLEPRKDSPQQPCSYNWAPAFAGVVIGRGDAAPLDRYAMRVLRPFHLAFPVHDLAAARAFYGNTLGCREGRSSEQWIDFDLHGHQIVAHLDPSAKPVAVTNAVDGHAVPVPHFGLVLTMPDWRALAARLEVAGTKFGIAPHIRFVGQPGEQATMFFYDPSGNALEFKAFADDAVIFAT